MTTHAQTCVRVHWSLRASRSVRTLAGAHVQTRVHACGPARADMRAHSVTRMLTGTCRHARALSYTRAAEEPSETSSAGTERPCYAQAERLQAHSPAHT